MSRPRSCQNIKCPDCGGAVRKNGRRKGTTIARYVCLNEGDDAQCNRRFTDNTMFESRKDKKKVIPPPVTKEALDTEADVFIFTWAQNDTPVMRGFWNALTALQNYRDADLNVILGRYRNPTAIKANLSMSHQVWCKDVMPYMWNQRADICEGLQILGDIMVRPTAVRPLTGFESITGGIQSAILGHPKLAMQVIPTPQSELPKVLLTTGACTLKNYSDSKAGKKGEFHHTYGATIVEVAKDGTYFMRSINATKDGSFIDMDMEFHADGTVTPAGPAKAISMGDWHSGFTDPNVIKATFEGEDSMVAVLKPGIIIWDDLIDFYGRNHHHMLDPFIGAGKAAENGHNWNDMRAEVEFACAEVNDYTAIAEMLTGAPVQSVLKADNHGEAFSRYIRERNWKNDPQNAEFYLETALRMMKSTRMTKTGVQYTPALNVWLKELCPNAIILNRRDSYMVGDIECAYHGDIGPNGARGNIRSFAKIGVKTIINHAHTPGIEDGCYQGGTSTYTVLEYTKGPSSWMQVHTVIYANGKRALFTIVGPNWRHV